jgi:competence protein ComFC
MELVEGPVRLLFPEVCQVCGNLAAVPSDGYVCVECLRCISSIQFPFCERCGLPFEGEIQHGFQCQNCHDLRLFFVYARSACAANSLMLDLLHRYKYGNARWLDALFERLLGDAVSNSATGKDWDCVIPVPLYPVRQRERGYNQSDILAQSVGERLQIPCFSTVVKRIAHTPSQTMLNRNERAANVAKAFEVIDSEKIIKRRILIIDDVLTTGATANECSRVCLRAGACSVHVWTLARGLGVIGGT